MRLEKVIFAATVISLTMASTAFAGTWKTGAAPNQNRWWYDFDNGSYANNGWQWIDSNNDGVAECYYFDKDGWMLADTTTPDGYKVNASGAWVENNTVQTKNVQATAQTQAQKQTAAAQSQYASLSGVYQLVGIDECTPKETWGLDAQWFTSINLEVIDSNDCFSIKLNNTSPLSSEATNGYIICRIPANLDCFATITSNNSILLTVDPGSTAFYEKIK